MADEQSPHDSELTPEQEATVRRLLAEARHDEGIPDDVADRLDRVLARLHDEPAAADSPVVELAARRRRRNAGRLLMAAAAIVLGGTVAGQLVGSSEYGSDGGADSPAADSKNLRSAGPGAESYAEQDEPADGAAGAEEAAPEAAAPDGSALDAGDGTAALADRVPVRLSRQSFDEDVRSLADERNQALKKLASSAERQRRLIAGLSSFDCPPAAYGRGALVPAYYDDEPVVLAFRPPLGSNQVAELLRCGTAEKLRSVQLDAPANN